MKRCFSRKIVVGLMLFALMFVPVTSSVSFAQGESGAAAAGTAGAGGAAGLSTAAIVGISAAVVAVGVAVAAAVNDDNGTAAHAHQ